MRTDPSFPRTSLPFSIALLTCSFASLSGCSTESTGPPRAAVSGTVTLDTVPLDQAIVRFVPTDGHTGPMTSLVVSDGTFEAAVDDGPTVGTHRVEIVSTDDGGYAPDDEVTIERLRSESHVKRRRTLKVVKVVVPAAFNDNSQLRATITADDINELRFDLKTPPRSRR